ncbi:MAG: hypothetical protein KatS3mg031_1792 [Chitinophagales bacterium]|nr:MAG: hypothetical protein KatS3mg031_1792 [Chitinophagales bacterium]
MHIREKLNVLRKKFLRLDFNAMLSLENIASNLPYFLFLVFLAMLYISNTHSVENTIRNIDRMKAEVKEIRWNYISAKAELMFKSKQTEVARAVEPLGLKELVNPPKKIVVDDEH